MNDPFLVHLTQLFSLDPPGVSAHLEMAPVSRIIPTLSDSVKSNAKQSAVSVVIYPKENELFSVLIQRPLYEGKHSGQIAFPGGKSDPDDLHLEETARRECFEEIGIPKQMGILLKELTQVYIPVSNFVVYPFVFYYPELPGLIADSREVSEIIHFPLKELVDPENRSTMEIRFDNGIKQKNIPCFLIQDRQVWGATALILNELKFFIQ